jgi:GNAT superfamily N-acetyltransferase
MPQPHRRNAIEIQRIYLRQDQTGQGQGKYLMNYCLEWARGTGYGAVWLGVWERNKRALEFYRKMGFEQFGYHYFLFGSKRQRDFWLYKALY